MKRSGTWRTLGILVAAVAVAACGTNTSPATPSPPPAAPAVSPVASPGSSPAPSVAAWVPAGTMRLARTSTHAALLEDGRVLVVGNDNICTPGGAWKNSVRAELYDPAAGTWAETASLNAPRTDFAAATLPDGTMLLTGGLTSAVPHDGPFGAFSSTKVFDPATGTWTSAGLLVIARTEPAVAVLADGRVLAAGGVYVDEDTTRVLVSAEIFDPDTGTWARTGAMRTVRRGAKAVALADGRVLVVGGSSTGRRLYSGDTTISTGEVYDPSSGTWSPTGTLLKSRAELSLVALLDGGALVVGGGRRSAERLDPRTLAWSDAGSLSTAATERTAIVLGDGRVLVAGGHVRTGETSDGPGETLAIADAELYDPVAGTWTPTTTLPEPRAGAGAVTLQDGSVLLVGGDRGYLGDPATPWCPDPIAEAVRYVPENLASFPMATAAVARSGVARATAKPADARSAASSITPFGLDLYKRMLADGTLDPKGNAVFSPTSIALALGMARAGARGDTAAEMDAVLHTAGWDALGPGLNALEQTLASRDATWTVEHTGMEVGTTEYSLALRIANAAFAQRGWTIVQDYLDAIASTIGAGLRLVDYAGDPEAQRKVINAWVKQKTAGRIPELIPKVPPLITELTRLVLVNAIYLKASWQVEFSEGLTKPRAFSRPDGSQVTVPTMSLEGGQSVPYATGPGWEATELRYNAAPGTAPLAMTLILPDDLAAIEGGLTTARLDVIVTKLDRQRARLEKVTHTPSRDCPIETYAYSLRLFMPRFGIDTAAGLKTPLEGLGMPLAFERGVADFTGIHVPASPDEILYIGEVIHQANIDVDEKGTEAAAATAVIGVATGGGCPGPEPAKIITLRLDRPFLFMLRDTQTGTVLFMGRVVDPSQR